jgi:HSP20 family molecular chaperone IbpA
LRPGAEPDSGTFNAWFGHPNLPSEEPLVSVYENEKAYLVLANVPGVSATSAALKIEDEELVLRATRPSYRPTGSRYEPPVTYLRRIPIPGGADPEEVDASLTNGVMRVRIPKGTFSGGSMRDIAVETVSPPDEQPDPAQLSAINEEGYLLVSELDFVDHDD